MLVLVELCLEKLIAQHSSNLDHKHLDGWFVWSKTERNLLHAMGLMSPAEVIIWFRLYQNDLTHFSKVGEPTLVCGLSVLCINIKHNDIILLDFS